MLSKDTESDRQLNEGARNSSMILTERIKPLLAAREPAPSGWPAAKPQSPTGSLFHAADCAFR
jgi:hypothetical protein